jgi:hypothetical protein
MAIDTSTLEATLQTKFDNVTDPKEMLLLGKAYEATVGGIAVSDIEDAGAAQVATINSVATSTFKTVSGQSILGTGDIAANDASALTQGTLDIDRMASGTIINVGFAQNSTRYALSDASDRAVFQVSYNKLRSATETKIIVVGQIPLRAAYSDYCGVYFDCLTAGVTCHNTNDSAAFKGINQAGESNSSRPGPLVINQVWENTTYLGAGTHTFEWGWRTRNGTSGDKPGYQCNMNSSDDGRQHQTSSTFVFYEVLR